MAWGLKRCVWGGGGGRGSLFWERQGVTLPCVWQACLHALQVVSYQAGAGLGSIPLQASSSAAAARKRKRGGARNRQKWVCHLANAAIVRLLKVLWTIRLCTLLNSYASGIHV